jgi:hypothetical protein
MKTGVNRDGSLQPQITRTKLRGSNEDAYECYLTFANDGKGGDITRGGAPLKTFEEWLNS